MYFHSFNYVYIVILVLIVATAAYLIDLYLDSKKRNN